MRKNTARHWLHAGLDLLPILLIPVFMVYSHRHTIDSGSIEVPINRVVDFNQLIDLENQTYTYDNLNVEVDKPYVNFNGVSSGAFWYSKNSVSIQANHKYLFKGLTNTNIYIIVGGSNTWSTPVEDGAIFTVNWNDTDKIGFTGNDTFNNVSFIPQLFDLTQMFGVGNEPTTQQFNTWYSNDYYDYVLSRKELLKGYSTQTYNDTDIMSQFTYQLYNSVDKYFNMGNVFGMSGLYDWFNLNIFGGNASISIYIVWNIVLYEFVMDLLFLLYALFMWFIDMMKHIMEKPFRSIK